MCERDGYTKLSIRSLAKESNVSQTAPYRHFKTKEDLYAEIAKEGFNKLYKTISKVKSKNIEENLNGWVAGCDKDSKFISETCIDLWAKMHGLVGLLRKLEVVPSKLLDMPDTPFMALNSINNDLNSYIKKFIRATQ